MAIINKLKNAELKKLPDGLHADGNGLYLRVRGNSRSWIFRYRAGGKLHDVGLGSLNDISLAQARFRLKEYREAAAKGISPIIKRKSELRSRASGMSFKEAAQACIARLQEVRMWKSDRQAARWSNTIEQYAKPILDKTIQSITSDDILECLNPIWRTKTETASNLQRYLARVFDYAKMAGELQGDNPARWKGCLDHFLPAPSKIQNVVHHPAIEVSKVPEMFWELSGHKLSIATQAIMFGTLTATRAQEFVDAKWEEFDLETKTWSIPPERRKDMKPYPHRIPLSEESLQILSRLPKLNEYVFPSPSGNKPIHRESPIKYLKKLFPGQNYTMHGMRSTFRDWCAENGIDPILAEKSLMHATGNEVELAYQRSDLLERRRPVMEEWSKYCFSLIVKKQKQSEN
ncbi:tyrosine-type recombinase/integrase [Turicimonas muris]|uniref:tyrosine-type recombinase/integrase n=1 Tax=Turicimonas muris TaxID=1796652 RepID=UPI002675AD51|nr:site-specific integrase [Turicimonas muris]